MSKVYTISDLFFTKWEDLSDRTKANVYSLMLQLRETEAGSQRYGLVLIQILRQIRRRPRLVNKITVEQAVDIFNDLKFLSAPFYTFPGISDKLSTPDEKMARSTFDHFIYADNEYSSFISNQDQKHLFNLVATIYQAEFDKELVHPIARELEKRGRVKEWQLLHVFFSYSHVRDFVTKRCKTLMPAPARKPEDDILETKPSATGAMWLKLKHRLAETAAFLGYDKAGTANMYSALDYLEDLAQIKENAKH